MMSSTSRPWNTSGCVLTKYIPNAAVNRVGNLEDWLTAEKELTESYLEFRYMTLSHKQMVQTLAAGRIN